MDNGLVTSTKFTKACCWCVPLYTHWIFISVHQGKEVLETPGFLFSQCWVLHWGEERVEWRKRLKEWLASCCSIHRQVILQWFKVKKGVFPLYTHLWL